MKPEIIVTEDGSHSLYLPELNETYHSRKGAIQESQYVFIEKGLHFFLQSTNSRNVRILEVGFGTGLNTFLSYLACLELGLKCQYTTLEPRPLEKSVIEKLNYQQILSAHVETWDHIHTSEWHKDVKLSDGFSLTKLETSLEEYSMDPTKQFDIIYFDAFAPSKQPEIWEVDNLTKCYDSLKPGGLLVTYCAQGAFKRSLKSIGFEVETLPGPPGKQEMVRGLRGSTGLFQKETILH